MEIYKDPMTGKYVTKEERFVIRRVEYFEDYHKIRYIHSFSRDIGGRLRIELVHDKRDAIIFTEFEMQNFLHLLVNMYELTQTEDYADYFEEEKV